ncbi:unnamed protein product [Urochloa humidicola]
MAPNKSLVLLAATLLLAAAVGQVRCGGLLPVSNLVVVVVSGIVPCSIGSNISLASVPPFPNATVQVVCGSTTVASATTGIAGAFVLSLGSVSNLTSTVLTALLSGQCRLVVATPLVACNASLAGVNGTLSAPLQLLGGITNTGGGLVGTIVGITVTIVNSTINLVTEVDTQIGE